MVNLMNQELTIESKELSGKNVEFTDPDGKYMIGQVKVARNYDATLVLPNWHHPKDDNGRPIENKKIHSKLKVPKEFIGRQITKRFTRKITWPEDKRPRFKIDQMKLEYRKLTNHKVKRRSQKLKAKRKKDNGDYYDKISKRSSR